MKCRVCDRAEMNCGPETHLYRECGLPNVVIVGLEMRRCPSCGHCELVIPKITDLHRKIALAVIRKPSRLSPPEIKFLRKYMGWSGTDFADHAGVDASTVSAWENGKDPIGAASDRLLRMMVVHGAPVEDYSVDELTKIENEQKPPIEVRISSKSNGWEQEQLIEAA